MNGCGCESGSKSHSWLPRAPIVRTPLAHKHQPAADITVSRCNLCLALADWGVGRRANSLAEEFRFLASRRRRNKSTRASDWHRRERRPHVAASKRAFFGTELLLRGFFFARVRYIWDVMRSRGVFPEARARRCTVAPLLGAGRSRRGKKGFLSGGKTKAAVRARFPDRGS